MGGASQQAALLLPGHESFQALNGVRGKVRCRDAVRFGAESGQFGSRFFRFHPGLPEIEAAAQAGEIAVPVRPPRAQQFEPPFVGGEGGAQFPVNAHVGLAASQGGPRFFEFAQGGVDG
ncbi:MAG: hypothetical protein Q4C13_08995, partial [Clostridia bacterium]|nr:hypothetical protein [Clostridia bacterium]